MKSLPYRLRIAIEFMRARIESNVALIRQNTSAMKVGDSANFLRPEVQKNRRLIEENHELLDLQIRIIKYVSKYHLFINENVGGKSREVIEDHEKIKLSPKEILEKTISNELVFDERHPYYGEEVFFKELLDKYLSEEKYEKCAELISLKSIWRSHNG